MIKLELFIEVWDQDGLNCQIKAFDDADSAIEEYLKLLGERGETDTITLTNVDPTPSYISPKKKVT